MKEDDHFWFRIYFALTWVGMAVHARSVGEAIAILFAAASVTAVAFVERRK